MSHLLQTYSFIHRRAPFYLKPNKYFLILEKTRTIYFSLKFINCFHLRLPSNATWFPKWSVALNAPRAAWTEHLALRWAKMLTTGKPNRGGNSVSQHLNIALSSKPYPDHVACKITDEKQCVLGLRRGLTSAGRCSDSWYVSTDGPEFFLEEEAVLEGLEDCSLVLFLIILRWNPLHLLGHWQVVH